MNHLASLAFVVAAAALATGCGTSSTIDQSPTPVKCQVTLAAVPSIDPSGGTGVIAVTTQPECAWDASTSAAWISSLSPASGQGTAQVSFRVAANDGSGTREGNIVINGETARVSQRPPCRYEVSPATQTIGVSGGAGSITITTASECAWTANADAGWISLDASTSGTGNGRIAFTVSPNQGEARNGSIVVANQRAAIAQTGPSAPVPAPPGCTTAISPTLLTMDAFGGAGGPVTISAGSTCQWTAVSNASWITITAGAAGTGPGSTAFTVAANTGIERIGTLTIAGRTFTVTQRATIGAPPPPPSTACSYAISPGAASSPAGGGTTGIQLTTAAGCGWTTSSSASWLTVSSGVSGTGSGSVNVSIAANTGGARTATIFIADQTFTVNQAAASQPAACSYAISPGSFSLPASGAATTVQLTTAAGCGWTTSSSASWLTVASGASGTGSGSVSVSIAANTGGARTGMVFIADQTFSVTQAAAVAPCTYSITPTSQNASAAATSGSVGVTAAGGCAWIATTNASWLTVTSGASGAGNGSVGYSVAANTGGSRSGTLTIAGQTFTVTQAAGTQACSYSVSPSSQRVGPNNGSGTFNVSSGSTCAWTAASNASWITVTGGASGSGNGSVTFSVVPNPTGDRRTGTLTIAGRSVTVEQNSRGGNDEL